MSRKSGKVKRNSRFNDILPTVTQEPLSDKTNEVTQIITDITEEYFNILLVEVIIKT